MSRWVPVPGYEGSYEVSDQGVVRSLPNRSRSGTRVLRQHYGRGGYRVVTLHKDGKGRTHLAHRLVALAFLGGPVAGQEVCHNNGVRDDNRVENLRWDTRSANTFDAVLHGNHPMASRTHCLQGHEFSAENTTLRPDGARRCKECSRVASRRAYWKSKEASL